MNFFQENWKVVKSSLLESYTVICCQICKEMEDADWDFIAKIKMPAQGSDTIRTFKFRHKRTTESQLKSLLKELKVWRHSIRGIAHEDHWYKSCDAERGQSISAKTTDNCLICTKCLLSKFKPQQPGILCFFFYAKSFDQDWKIWEWMIDGYTETLRTF